MEGDGASEKGPRAKPAPPDRQRILDEEEAEADMGVHLPGVFPEQETLLPDGPELSEHEKAVLADVAEMAGHAAEKEATETPAEPSTEELSQAAAAFVRPAPRGAALSPLYLVINGAASVVLATAGTFVLTTGGQPGVAAIYFGVAAAALFVLVRGVARLRAVRRGSGTEQAR